MSADDESGVPMPTIPYFYHDLAARIVPGAIQLGLIALLLAHTDFPLTHESAVVLARIHGAAKFSAVGSAFALLGLSYFVGVVFEGVLFWPQGQVYILAFTSALNHVRKASNAKGGWDWKAASRISGEVGLILDTYEPLAPHFFARATRFLAEAKMMLFSAVALPCGLAIVWISTGRFLPPGGPAGEMLAVVWIAALV